MHKLEARKRVLGHSVIHFTSDCLYAGFSENICLRKLFKIRADEQDISNVTERVNALDHVQEITLS